MVWLMHNSFGLIFDEWNEHNSSMNSAAPI
jgi:hypothetical protein